nr:MAG TPA: hypothetical protein [Caudoviricetes sp.]DAJ73913.1 MAG TPA: hypothetical protein [Caudoviricetes sp.]DAL00237.1 MAG TPA: hypothetical protein [Caudoviricetes sp.]DAM11660.1 MAG TPA: hypothetical protein [Caudoviricetes sp.]DAU08302.1 MAG TPA: hypothetical protein [Caudoviricetes sp.]
MKFTWPHEQKIRIRDNRALKNEKLVSKSGALRHYGFSIPSI